MENESQKHDMEIENDESFSYDGYQVVRGEFFSHIFEPSFTFNNYKIQVNTACIKKLPEYDYIQIMVNPNEKKLAVRPCLEDEKDSFRWCSATAKRSPKQITCKLFFAKVFSLMGWNPNYRYKLLGKLKKAQGQFLFIFDLTAPEVYQKTSGKDGTLKNSRIPVFPEEWKNQFGLPVEEHRSSMQVNIFQGYAVFALQKEQEKKTIKSITAESTAPESEAQAYEPFQGTAKK